MNQSFLGVDFNLSEGLFNYTVYYNRKQIEEYHYNNYDKN